MGYYREVEEIIIRRRHHHGRRSSPLPADVRGRNPSKEGRSRRGCHDQNPQRSRSCSRGRARSLIRHETENGHRCERHVQTFTRSLSRDRRESLQGRRDERPEDQHRGRSRERGGSVRFTTAALGAVGAGMAIRGARDYCRTLKERGEREERRRGRREQSRTREEPWEGSGMARMLSDFARWA